MFMKTLDSIGQINEKVVKAVKDKFYTDDYLDSFDSLEGAISIKEVKYDDKT